ncbi:MAG: ABC transporter substrate-binding protein/permease [Thermodesulfovibrionales bacterium]
MRRFLRPFSLLIGLAGLLFVAVSASAPPEDTLEKIRMRGALLWGSDAEGGAPYIFPDPKDPSKMIGFEVDLADAISRELGVKAQQSQNAWDSLVPALKRGDFDIAMNGLEITPQKKEEILFSKPYYVYVEQLVVRKDEEHIRGMADLPGKRVGTLSGAVAQEILTAIKGVDVRVYPGQVEPYEDLAIGRIDAVLLDLPIAAYYGKSNPKLMYTGEPVGEGFYGIAIRKGDEALKARIDEILGKLYATGELRKIYEKWDLWNQSQEKLAQEFGTASGSLGIEESKRTPLATFLPALFRGAAITVLISTVSMALAIVLGLVLVVMKIYGGGLFSIAATSYIELYRGTPLLIQLYILYYGLPNVGITLSPLVAAILGLGMNYAAYEAELYRAGINAVPRGQMEAALSLGMPRKTAIRRIILPQAVRVALPGVTNDFIALFKDSSLVSVIAMVELTKTYSIHAATTLRFFELGLITALLYFGMSFPLSLLARRLEEKLKGKRR